MCRLEPASKTGGPRQHADCEAKDDCQCQSAVDSSSVINRVLFGSPSLRRMEGTNALATSSLGGMGRMLFGNRTFIFEAMGGTDAVESSILSA